MSLDGKKDQATSAFAGVNRTAEAKVLKSEEDWAELRKIEGGAERDRDAVNERNDRTREVDTARELVRLIETSDPNLFAGLSPTERVQLLRESAGYLVGQKRELELLSIEIAKEEKKQALYKRAAEVADQKARTKLKSDFAKGAKDRSRER